MNSVWIVDKTFENRKFIKHINYTYTKPKLKIHGNREKIYIPEKILRDEFIFAMVKQTQVLCEFQSVKSSRPTCVLLLKAENTGQSHGATQDNCAITLSNNICIKCTTVSRIIFYFSMSFCFFVAFPSSFLLLFRTCQILRQKKTIESPWYFDCMSPMFWLNMVRQAGNKNTKKARIFLLCFNNYYCFIRFYSCLSFFLWTI